MLGILHADPDGVALHPNSLICSTNKLLLSVLLVLALSLTVVSGSQVKSADASSTSTDDKLVYQQTHRIGTVTVKDLPEKENTDPIKDQKLVHGIQEKNLAAKAIVQQPGYIPPGEATKIIATSPVLPQGSAPTTGLVLDGASGSAPNPCACTPPDTNNAVGPNHVFEMVNLAGIIYSKTGTLVKATFGLDSFFNLPASSMTDPQVMYDNISGRWFTSIDDVPAAIIEFGVSTSNDPTGSFVFYTVSAGATLPDQPFIATSNDVFAISVNVFNTRGTSFLGVKYWILNKSQLLNGAPTVNLATINPDSTVISLRPVRSLSASSTLYMVTNCTGSCVTSTTSLTTTATFVALTGIPPAAVTRKVSSFSIAASVQPPNADQPGGTSLVTNDNRILSVVWESNILWFTWADSCVPTGDSVNRSCLRLVQANTNNTITKLQDFDFSVSGGHLFYPALSSYKGQLVVAYGSSSTTKYPSLLVTGRLATDPVNTLETPVTLRTGTAADTSTRYGDYFGAATDPVPTQASTFWVSGEYRASPVAGDWSTAIGQVGSLAAPPPTFNQTNTFQGYRTTTTGSLVIDPVMSSVNGTASVIVRNQTTGTIIFSRTYQLSGIHLFNRTTILQASFVLDIAVTPYHLSSDINVRVTGNLVSVTVLVTRQVDIDRSGVVTIIDIGILAAAFGTSSGDPRYNPLADIDGSGTVSIIDFGIVAAYFGSTDFL